MFCVYYDYAKIGLLGHIFVSNYAYMSI